MDPTYSEHEVAEVIALAVERQRAAERRAAEGGGGGAAGLTLAEIEAVGRGAGIDPAHLRAAAAEVAAGGAVPDAGTNEVVVERWADAPLTDAGWEDVVAHLRAAPGVFGTPADGDDRESIKRLGQSLEWTRVDATFEVTTRVNVSPRGDRTRIRLTQHGDPLEGGAVTAGVYGAAAGGLAAAAALLLGAGGGLSLAAFVAVSLAVFLVSLPYARKSTRELMRTERARLSDLADALVPLVEDAAEQTGGWTGEGGAVGAPALGGALLDSTPPEAADGERTGRRVRS